MLPVLLEFCEFCEFCDTGCGRAKGLGGPDAPAERRADAEGEGGGRTTPETDGWSFRCAGAAFVAEWGEESALPPSEAPSGICTVRTGRFVPPTEALFVRGGGAKLLSDAADIEALRFLGDCCGGLDDLEEAPVSID